MLDIIYTLALLSIKFSVFFIVLFILGDDVERGDQLEQQGAAHYHDEQQLRRAQGERLQEV